VREKETPHGGSRTPSDPGDPAISAIFGNTEFVNAAAPILIQPDPARQNHPT
jgi:hypothetical protein